MKADVHNKSAALLGALIAIGVVLDAVAQAPQPAPKATARPALAPAPAAPPSVQPPPSTASQPAGRLGMGALLEQFTTLDERDISVLVTSGDETTLSSQMAGKIKKIHFGLGDNVGVKAVLLEFDCEEQDA